MWKSMLASFLILAAAVGIGLALNFFFRGPNKETVADEQGASVRDILGATALLAGLLIAIVLSGASSSYTAARTAAKTEADTVDNLYEAAEYVALPARQAIQAAAVCYSRAVLGPEWDTMATGEASPVPNSWTGTGPQGLRKTFIEMTSGAQGFGLVVAADQQRGELRNERLLRANPTVPSIISWLMLLLVALSLGGLAYSVPKKNNLPQFVVLGIVTVLYWFVLSLIQNFDRPFTGMLALEPTSMQEAERDISQDYATTYNAEPSCDGRGQPR